MGDFTTEGAEISFSLRPGEVKLRRSSLCYSPTLQDMVPFDAEAVLSLTDVGSQKITGSIVNSGFVDNGGVPITFTITRSSRVSLNIMNSTWVVQELLRTVQLSQGTYTFTGMDTMRGQAKTAGDYTNLSLILVRSKRHSWLVQAMMTIHLMQQVTVEDPLVVSITVLQQLPLTLREYTY